MLEGGVLGVYFLANYGREVDLGTTCSCQVAILDRKVLAKNPHSFSIICTPYACMQSRVSTPIFVTSHYFPCIRSRLYAQERIIDRRWMKNCGLIDPGFLTG